MSNGVYNFLGFIEDACYGQRLPKKAKEEAYKSVKKALSYLTNEEIDMLGDLDITISPNEVYEEREDGVSDVVGYASRHHNRYAIMLAPENNYFGNEEEFSKSVTRTTLHELGHILNYRLEEKYGEEFWSMVDKVEPRYLLSDGSYEYCKWEDFTETFVVGKIRDNNLNLLKNNKKGMYSFNEELLDFINKELNSKE